MTDAGIVVRGAKPSDAAAIARVHIASWRAAYAGIVPQSILDGLSEERRAEYWRETTTNPGDVRTWVAEVADRIEGLASAGPCRDDDLPAGAGELWAIYVDPATWGRGVGRALLDAAVTSLRERRFDPLVLWVLEDNRRGRTFYERHGWRPDGAARDLDFAGTAVREVRYLAPAAGSDRTIG